MKKLLPLVFLFTFSAGLLAQAQNVAAPIAPYSPAVKAGSTLYVSGQIPVDPATKKLITGDIKEQTRRVMKNIGAILETYGMNYSNLVQCTIYLTNLDNYGAVNEAYAEFFDGHFPARVCIQVVRLPMSAEIEIGSVAVDSRLLQKKR